jgi:predicted MarR family transcription regulator
MSSTKASADNMPRSPIVSSAHLAAGEAPSLSEVEFGLIVAGHSFSRWMVQCMAAAGYPDLSPIEILILHTVRHRSKPKRLANICLVLHIEDTHLVTYAIRKLEQAKLVKTGRVGKEKTVSATDLGVAACMSYAEIREKLLVKSVNHSGISGDSLSDLAGFLRVLSGYYDQSSRSAATL